MVSQQVIAPPAVAAIFLVVTVAEGAEDKAAAFLSDFPALSRAVGFREPEMHLNAIVGLGSDFWDRLYGTEGRPRNLIPFREIVGGRHTAPATPGDMLIHLRAVRTDMVFELARIVNDRFKGWATIVDEVHGFRYFDERDLLGFVDGTENPEGRAAQDAVLIGGEDPAWAGGSYVTVQKYLHDLESWKAISVEEQERVIGRTKLDDIELPDDVKPETSHVARNTIDGPDGKQIQIVRDNMPFGSFSAGEMGTYFIGYARDPKMIEDLLVSMFIGQPEGTYDRILDFSTAKTGSTYFIPPEEFLDDPREFRDTHPAPRTADDTTENPQPAPESATSANTDSSLHIGSLKPTAKTPAPTRKELA